MEAFNNLHAAFTLQTKKLAALQAEFQARRDANMDIIQYQQLLKTQKAAEMALKAQNDKRILD